MLSVLSRSLIWHMYLMLKKLTQHAPHRSSWHCRIAIDTAQRDILLQGPGRRRLVTCCCFTTASSGLYLARGTDCTLPSGV